MKILIAEDENVSRKVLKRMLENWGHEVVEADNGAEALDLCRKLDLKLVISDWMMPGMDGIELCRRIRSATGGAYVYFVLLTAKSQMDDLVDGLDAGADDFVGKPFDPQELRARLRAGERIVKLEEDLRISNRKIQDVNEGMHRDLSLAADVQKALLPEEAPKIPGFHFAWEFKPCSYVAGDLLNVFHLDERRWGFYVLDVSGHGVSSAMLSVTIAQSFMSGSGSGSLLKRTSPEPPYYEILSPRQVVEALRNRFPHSARMGLYFTLTYAVIDTETGELSWLRAGHTPPLIVTNKREILFYDVSGGPPISFWPENMGIEEEAESVILEPGDRFYLYSDGIIEARNSEREIFSEKRFAEILRDCGDRSLEESLNEVVRASQEWQGSDELQDDVTILALERNKPL